jgi:AcrR family transcriptional regulator
MPMYDRDRGRANDSRAIASGNVQMTKSVHPAKKHDRRVARTRQQLREALVTLVLERGWDAVSVTDVCNRANLGRSTLYLHFADKEDLLFSGFAQLEAALESVRAAAPGQFAFARELLAHTQGHLKLFRALADSRTSRRVIQHLRGISARLVTSELGSLRIARPQVPLLTPYIAGGLVELIVAGLEGSTRQSADELAAGFVSLTPGLLEHASAGSSRPRCPSSG